MYESILVQTGQLYKYALNSNISVTLYYKYFLSKNKTKAKLRDIEAAYCARTESIYPISDTIKVGASYRFRSDGNNNFDISKIYM
jgi:opacity protein-like surface antigen